MEVKLTKTEINELLKYISKDNETYGLILKLMYIYGRSIREVVSLKKKDINLQENTITFKDKTNTYQYPIHEDIQRTLAKYLETENEYIFQKEGKEISPIRCTHILNSYLETNTHKFKKLLMISKPLSLSTIDFKVLRGQHLFLDGVNIESIHELYGYKTLDSTRRIINYTGLKNKGKVSMDGIFDDFTDLNVFKNEEYKIYDQFYCSKGNEECMIVVNKLNGEVSLTGDNRVKKLLNLGVLKDIKDYGDYKIVNGVKMLKV